MIEGYVNHQREAVVRLLLRGPANDEVEVDAIIDTGFTGTFSLPPTIISHLNLTFLNQGRAFLADGTAAVFDIYEATVILDDEERRITVDEANIEPVADMNLLYGKTLTIQIVDGGAVWITSLADDLQG